MTDGGTGEVKTFAEMRSAALARMQRTEHTCGYLVSLTKDVRSIVFPISEETYILLRSDAASEPEKAKEPCRDRARSWLQTYVRGPVPQCKLITTASYRSRSIRGIHWEDVLGKREKGTNQSLHAHA